MSCCCKALEKITNPELKAWVKEFAEHTTPANIVVCDGSQEEFDRLAAAEVARGAWVKLNEKKRPGCYLVRSHESDVARVEKRTYICCKDKNNAGPTNNWMDPTEMKQIMWDLYAGCMKGRTLYVIPFSMGPIGSPLAKLGVELTDSPYVVCNMRIMTRMGDAALELINKGAEYVKCYHSVGAPLEPGQADVAWPCAPMEKKYITQFTDPGEEAIWSFGSGYGGNALLGKKCFALRIASVLARKEGWMAEHMLILKLTSPEGKSYFITAAFPSACGKTNLAMMLPTLPGWKVETCGDDIAWMHVGKDGALYAINPENGFFGVAPGTSKVSNPNALHACEKNTIFTNVVLTDDGDVWWEDMGVPAPAHGIDWKGNDCYASKEKPNKMVASPDGTGEPIKAAHPNSRFTAPAVQCPVIAKEWEAPEGVPVTAILFGGRRPSTIPLVNMAKDWAHGVYMGSAAGSEVTAAVISDQIGQVRRDPMAMLPFCGYNMADYFGHWLEMGKKIAADKLPKIFFVNWFRKDADGHFMWPGFGDNSRVLKWACEAIEGTAKTKDTPIGIMPTDDAIDLTGCETTPETLHELLTVDLDGWKKEVAGVKESWEKFGDRIPAELTAKLEEITAALNA